MPATLKDDSPAPALNCYQRPKCDALGAEEYRPRSEASCRTGSNGHDQHIVLRKKDFNPEFGKKM